MTDKEKPGESCGGSDPVQNLPARTSPLDIVRIFAAFNPKWAAALRLHEHREAWRAQFRPDLSDDPVIQTHDKLWGLLFVGKVAWVSLDPPAVGNPTGGYRVRFCTQGRTEPWPLFFVTEEPVARDLADCIRAVHRCMLVHGTPWVPEASQ